MAELKPCPFCGSSDCHTRRHINNYSEEWRGVKCCKCGVELANRNFDIPTDAMDAWNRRTDDGNKQ